MRGMSPLREYELAVERVREYENGIAKRRIAHPGAAQWVERVRRARPGTAAGLAWHRRNLARARRRLILSALAYVVIASVAVGILWVLLVLAAASAPLPTDIQLPTI